MAIKDDLKAAIQAVADASGNLNLRSAIGVEGVQFLIDGEPTASGQGWAVPGFTDALVQGIAAVMVGLQGARYEDDFISTGQTTYVLGNAPRSAPNMKSGADLLVFKDGMKMRHRSIVAATNEYSFVAATRTVSFLAAPASVYCFVYNT